MIRMLASVRDLDEARIVFDAGVDLIDLKQPADGALGALPPEVISEVVGFVAIRLFFTLDTDAAEETLEKLARLTDRYCVVSQPLNVRPTLTVRRQLSA